jgi:phytoene dehydrogenase-like protein
LGETHLSELKTLLAKGQSASKKEIKAWVETYCNLSTYEISIPSLRDKNLSPEGKTSLIISFLFEYDLVRLVHDAGWYDEFKLLVEENMIKTLDRTLFNGLLEEPELQFSFSPLSIENQFGNSEGGITGWTLEQPSPVVNKLKKIASSVKTAIPDIFQCGQWAYSPAGIPTAILTGWYAADAICAGRKTEQKKQ